MDEQRKKAVADFAAGARALVALARAIPPDAWERPGLGEWTVQELAGHAGRALFTAEAYLGEPPTGLRLNSSAEYYLAARGADQAQIAQRGREAGAALGATPARALSELADRVLAVIERADDDASVTTPFGVTMDLTDYLPTRTMELAVHCLDLARAVALPVPDTLTPAVESACELAGRIAARLPDAPAILLALAGRGPLPDGTRVV